MRSPQGFAAHETEIRGADRVVEFAQRWPPASQGRTIFQAGRRKNRKNPEASPRNHRAGRNQQFNAKATPETIQRFYTATDEKRVPPGELLKRGLDALEALDAFKSSRTTGTFRWMKR